MHSILSYSLYAILTPKPLGLYYYELSMFKNNSQLSNRGSSTVMGVLILSVLAGGVMFGGAYAMDSLQDTSMEDAQDINVSEEKENISIMMVNQETGEEIPIEDTTNLFDFSGVNANNIDEKQQEIDTISGMDTTKIDISVGGIDWEMWVNFREGDGGFSEKLTEEEVANLSEEWINEQEIEEIQEEMEEE